MQHTAERISLSHHLEDELRGLVVSGALPAGKHINEVHLARQLEVSRTPLREALTRLAGETFLEARPRLGFFVRPLAVAEIYDLYSMRARLDPWALELAGVPERAVLDTLDETNDAILAAAGDPARLVTLDDAWHLLLIDECPNHVLVSMIHQMMWRTRRYEHAYFRATSTATIACDEHRKIVSALRRKDLPAACKRLALNMTSALPALVRWLEDGGKT